jgi:tRNA-2-methylthio-N6-dimethylallyladenosine synthase
VYFARTHEVAAEAQYDSAFTFVFSPREGTEAAAMTDRFVPHEVCVERFEQLRVVIERSARAKNAARVGLVDEVIVEGPSKRDPSVLTGRTRQNKLVHFASESPLRAGTFADVRITEGASHYLYGELIEVTAPPRHRTRIAVTAS